MCSAPLSNKKSTVFFLSTLGILILTVILRCAAMLFEFDTPSGYFLHGAILPAIFNIICVAAVIFFGAFPILAFVGKELSIPSIKAPFTLAAILPAAASLAISFGMWRELLEIAPYLDGKELLISLIRPVLSLFLVVFLAAFGAGLKRSALTVISGILALFSLAVELTNIYNDLYVSMTSPNKTLLQISCIVTMLYIYCELRALFGAPQPRFFLFSLSTATVLLGAYTLPSLLTTAAGIYDNPYTLHDLFFAAFFILCLVRLIGISKEPICIEPVADYEVPDEVTEEATEEAIEETTEEPEEYPQNS